MSDSGYVSGTAIGSHLLVFRIVTWDLYRAVKEKIGGILTEQYIHEFFRQAVDVVAARKHLVPQLNFQYFPWGAHFYNEEMRTLTVSGATLMEAFTWLCEMLNHRISQHVGSLVDPVTGEYYVRMETMTPGGDILLESLVY